MNVKRINHASILTLRDQGLSIRKIAKEMGCSKSAVEYAIRLVTPKKEKVRELCLWKQGA